MKETGKDLRRRGATGALGAPGGAGGSAIGSRWRRKCPRGACLPARSREASPPLTLQDDLFERLPLQPVPAPQLLRDVALPAGEVGGSETRRHVACCPGASAPPIRAGAGSRGPQHEATGGRGKAGSPAAHLHKQAAPATIRNRLPALTGNGLGQGRKARLPTQRLTSHARTWPAPT